MYDFISYLCLLSSAFLKGLITFLGVSREVFISYEKQPLIYGSMKYEYCIR